MSEKQDIGVTLSTKLGGTALFGKGFESQPPGYNTLGGDPPEQGYSTQPGYQPVPQDYPVVTNQPYGPTTGAMGPTPPDYLIVSVLACLCCFWPTGLCAIYYAHRRNTLMAEGDRLEATRMSTNARKLTIISVVLGVIVMALFIIIIVVGHTAAVNSYNEYYDK